jgi:hypothetical protein
MVRMGSNDTTFILNLMKISKMVQKLKGAYIYRQQGDLISLLFFTLNKGKWTKNSNNIWHENYMQYQ